MYKLVLLRHGESQWNLENRFTGWTDVDLTEKGILEGKSAGKVLKEKGFTFDIAYASVLKRALRTLNLALDEMDLLWIPIEKSWRLNMRETRRLVLGATLAIFASLSLSTAAKADSEAGFIMIGSGSESGGVYGTGSESDSGGPLWTGSSSESGGPFATGAESDSGGALQSESSSESGGARNAGSSSAATWGGNEQSMGRYVQYYGR